MHLDIADGTQKNVQPHIRRHRQTHKMFIEPSVQYVGCFLAGPGTSKSPCFPLFLEAEVLHWCGAGMKVILVKSEHGSKLASHSGILYYCTVHDWYKEGAPLTVLWRKHECIIVVPPRTNQIKPPIMLFAKSPICWSASCSTFLFSLCLTHLHGATLKKKKKNPHQNPLESISRM